MASKKALREERERERKKAASIGPYNFFEHRANRGLSSAQHKRYKLPVSIRVKRDTNM